MPKGSKKKKDIDWASDQYFDPNRVMLYIEHTEECPVFKEKALQIGKYLQEQLPGKMIEVVRNQYGKVPPRPGAFEIAFSQNARSSIYNLWSGIDKGPPRREKIPADYSIMMPEVTRVMKKIYVKVTKVEDDLNKDKDKDRDQDEDDYDD